MTERIGDDCQPSNLTIPTYSDSTLGARAGEIKISGSKLHFWTGSDWEVATSASS